MCLWTKQDEMIDYKSQIEKSRFATDSKSVDLINYVRIGLYKKFRIKRYN